MEAAYVVLGIIMKACRKFPCSTLMVLQATELAISISRNSYQRWARSEDCL